MPTLPITPRVLIILSKTIKITAKNFSLNKGKINKKIQKKDEDKINNKEIERIQGKKAIRFLGIYIDEELNFEEHISLIAKKISKGVFALKTIAGKLPFKLRRMVYYALVESHLSYGNVIFGNATDKTLKSLIAMQNKAVKALIGVKTKTHVDACYSLSETLKFKDLARL